MFFFNFWSNLAQSKSFQLINPTELCIWNSEVNIYVYICTGWLFNGPALKVLSMDLDQPNKE